MSARLLGQDVSLGPGFMWGEGAGYVIRRYYVSIIILVSGIICCVVIIAVVSWTLLHTSCAE